MEASLRLKVTKQNGSLNQGNENEQDSGKEEVRQDRLHLPLNWNHSGNHCLHPRQSLLRNIMSLETQNYSDRNSFYYSSTMKKSRRSVREELELPSYLEDDSNCRNYEPSPARKQRSYFWEDFGFNLMHYVLVPLSVVALFCLFVYAEVNKATGY